MAKTKTRDLLTIDEELKTYVRDCRSSYKCEFTMANALTVQSLYMEIGQRFQEILKLIQKNVKTPLTNVSIGMTAEIDHDYEDDRYKWGTIDIYSDTLTFNVGDHDIYDISDLACYFKDNTVPEDVRKALIELMAYKEQESPPFDASSLVATTKTVSLEYTPQIIERMSLSLQK